MRNRGPDAEMRQQPCNSATPRVSAGPLFGRAALRSGRSSVGPHLAPTCNATHAVEAADAVLRRHVPSANVGNGFCSFHFRDFEHGAIWTDPLHGALERGAPVACRRAGGGVDGWHGVGRGAGTQGREPSQLCARHRQPQLPAHRRNRVCAQRRRRHPPVPDRRPRLSPGQHRPGQGRDLRPVAALVRQRAPPAGQAFSLRARGPVERVRLFLRARRAGPQNARGLPVAHRYRP